MIILNFLYHDPRPEVTVKFVPFFANHLAANGFPSSHATLMALIACILYVYNKRIGLICFYGQLRERWEHIPGLNIFIFNLLSHIWRLLAQLSLQVTGTKKI